MPDAFLTSTTLSAVSWQPLSACSYADTVAIFRFHVANAVDYQYPELRDHEVEQAQRYHRQEDRLRYIYTRRILRTLLGRYVNKHPHELCFSKGINKKPELDDNAGWFMNVSHSGDWIAVAIAKSSVGVDTEWVNPDFTFQDIVPQSFSQQEQAYIEASANRRFAFYDLWTRKEALVKATAKGLDDDFVQVPALGGTHVLDSRLIGASGSWMVAGFSISDDYPAAIAYRLINEVPKFYTVDSGLFSHFES